MSKALIKRGSGGGDPASGIVPAVASAIIPGVGQLINGETDKAIGVFAVAAISGPKKAITAKVGGYGRRCSC